jgi:hypothetical protein
LERQIATLSAYLLLGFTGNALFVIYHVYAHHRQVGTYRDAATARRGERLRTFMARTLTQQFAQAARIEATRPKRQGFGPYSWRNSLIIAHLVPLGILALAWLIGGWRGALVIFLAGLIGRSFHELINYVRHYGLVRGGKFTDQAASQLGLLPKPLQRGALQFAPPLGPSYVREQSLLAARHPANRADAALWLPDHGLHRAHPAALAPDHETAACRLG